MSVGLVAVAGSSREQIGWFWLGCGGMAAAALWCYARGVLSPGRVLLLAVVARLAVFPWPPGLSDDGFRYLWDGMLQHHAVNPYAWRPVDVAGYFDSGLLHRLNSESFYSVYPPLSQMLFWLSTVFDPSNWTSGWYVWKLLCLGAELGTLCLLRSLGMRALVLYGLHPLPVVELVGQAHTEAWMVFGLALCAWAMQRGRTTLALWGLAGAVLTKLYPLLLVPLLLRRSEDVRAAAGPLLVGGLLCVWYLGPAEVANLLSSVRLYTQYFEFNAGPYFSIKYLAALAGYGDVSKGLGPLLGGAFLCSALALVVLARRRDVPFARAAVSVLGAYLLFSTTVHPWYLSGVLVLLPFAGLTGWPWQWLGLASLGTYFLYVGGPYASIVWLGWGGALLLFLAQRWIFPFSTRSSRGEPGAKPVA